MKKILKIITIIILVVFVVYLTLYLIQKFNDYKYLNSVREFTQIPRDSFINDSGNCISSGQKPQKHNLSPEKTGSKCEPNVIGCQSSFPRFVEVCGNQYIIRIVPLSNPFITYGIFELKK